MVQRKLPKNIILQADHAVNKNNNQFQDLKNINNKVADLKKKKMKKSGSIKRHPELDNSLSLKRKPSKPPPASALTTSPNYMKPTTSSVARKEVSTTKHPQTSPTGSSSILRRRRSSNTSSKTTSAAGGNKATKTPARTLTKNPSFKPARKCSPVVVLCENLDSQRATCSSTLKDCKFPAFLSLNHGGTESEGTSKIKVCPYTYCSLNGHHHPPLPPLKCFLSARRRVIKNQRSMKQGCLSPKQKLVMQDDFKSSLISPLVEEEQKDFFIEIFGEEFEDAADETLGRKGDVSPRFSVQDERKSGFSSDSEDSVMDWGAGDHSCLNLDYDYEYSGETGEEVENQVIQVEFVTESTDKDGPLDELSADEVSHESLDEDSLSSDAFSSSDEDGESIDSYDYMHHFNIMNGSSLVQFTIEEPKKPASDAISNQEAEDYYIVHDEASFDNLQHESPQNEEANAAKEEVHEKIELSYEDQENSMTLIPSKEPLSEVAIVLKRSESGTAETAPARTADNCRKKLVEETDEFGIFDPRGPNFLPLEPDPEAERVDLRHQDLDERKNSEEWMVDYALRQVVTKLCPARKKRVSLLVEAFEKVMPINKFDLRLRHSSGFDQARPIQACN